MTFKEFFETKKLRCGSLLKHNHELFLLARATDNLVGVNLFSLQNGNVWKSTPLMVDYTVGATYNELRQWLNMSEWEIHTAK